MVCILLGMLGYLACVSRTPLELRSQGTRNLTSSCIALWISFFGGMGLFNNKCLTIWLICTLGVIAFKTLREWSLVRPNFLWLNYKYSNCIFQHASSSVICSTRPSQSTLLYQSFYPPLCLHFGPSPILMSLRTLLDPMSPMLRKRMPLLRSSLVKGSIILSLDQWPAGELAMGSSC